MSTYTDCLRTVVGISKNDCICYNAGDLPEYKLSKSGLYLDNYLYGLPLSYPAALFECDQNDLWELLVEAREQGIRRFMTEFGRATMSSGQYRKKYQEFVGDIGGQKKTALDPAGVYQVMEVTPRFTGPILQINSVVIRGDELIAGTGTVYLLDETMMNADDVSAPLATFTGIFDSTGAAKCVTADGKGIQIDCTTSDRFFIAWFNNNERAPYRITMDREIGCGCGGQAKTIAGWDTYTKIVTYPLTTLSNWPSVQGKTNAYTNGIQLQVSFACDALFLCDNVDFENDPFGRVVAELLVLYSNEQLIGYMLASDKVSIYTSARSEELIEKMAFIRGETTGRLEWVANNLPIGANVCYICNPRQRRRSLLV